MRFVRTDTPAPIDDVRDDGWFDEFSKLVDEMVAVRLMMDDVAETPDPAELYVTGR